MREQGAPAAAVAVSGSSHGEQPSVASIFRSSEHIAPAAGAASPTEDGTTAPVRISEAEVASHMRSFVAEMKRHDGIDNAVDAAIVANALASAASTGPESERVARRVLAASRELERADPPPPQVRLRNNAAPSSSRVRASRLPLAVSAFAPRDTGVDGPVLQVQPLISPIDPAAPVPPGMEGVSLRMRLLLAGSQIARRASSTAAPASAAAEPETHVTSEWNDARAHASASTRAASNFPLRSPLGVGAVLAMAAGGGGGGAESHRQVKGGGFAGVVAGSGPGAGAASLSDHNVLQVQTSLVASRPKKGGQPSDSARRDDAARRRQRKLRRISAAAKSAAAAATASGDDDGTGPAGSDSGELLNSSGDEHGGARSSSPGRPSFRRSYFDLKLSEDGPTRKQPIAERQKELAEAIQAQRHRQRAAEATAATATATAAHSVEDELQGQAP
jgi:hypothetical protein